MGNDRRMKRMINDTRLAHFFDSGFFLKEALFFDFTLPTFVQICTVFHGISHFLDSGSQLPTCLMIQIYQFKVEQHNQQDTTNPVKN